MLGPVPSCFAASSPKGDWRGGHWKSPAGPEHQELGLLASIKDTGPLLRLNSVPRKRKYFSSDNVRWCGVLNDYSFSPPWGDYLGSRKIIMARSYVLLFV